MTRLPGRPLPEQIVDPRTRETFDLDTSEARCPHCGFALADQSYITRIPQLGSWYNNASATCEMCGRTFQVRLVRPPTSLPPLSER